MFPLSPSEQNRTKGWLTESLSHNITTVESVTNVLWKKKTSKLCYGLIANFGPMTGLV